MARRCKCKGCGKELTTDKAFKDEKGKYWCSSYEYELAKKEKETKEECFKLMEDIMGVPFSSYARKRINEIHKYYNFEVIRRTIKFTEENLRWSVKQKSFNNEQAMVSYLATIMLNQINKIDKEYKKEIEEFQKLFEEKPEQDLEIINIIDEIPKNKKPKVNDISDFLDD